MTTANDRQTTTSYSRLVVTTALSCLVLKMARFSASLRFWSLLEAGHGDRWVRLILWGFLLASHSNHSSKRHRFRAMDMGQTDRQTDGRTAASFNVTHFGDGAQK